MIQVFKQYCDAGIVLIFTEESGLSDEDLLATGWNTYHSGLRYVHELSGQGLRLAVDRGDGGVERIDDADRDDVVEELGGVVGGRRGGDGS